MPPRTFPAVKDYYAGNRCVNCHPHLVYADDEPGGSCRFCDCTSHTPAAQAATPGVAAHPAPPVTGDSG